MVGGECFIKPAPDDMGGLAYQVVRRDCYNVLARGPGGITDVLLCERNHIGGRFFTLLERRSVDRRGYLTIQNKLYLSNTPTTLEYEIPLDSLPQYAALAPEHTYSVPFGGLGMAYVRMPMANTVDGSPDGVSIYESAVQLIHNIYKNEYLLGREFELGRSRIIVGADKLITPDPEGGVMRLKDDVFVGLDGETSGAGIDIFSPVLRDESFERRKQSYLKACENVIGLKRGLCQTWKPWSARLRKSPAARETTAFPSSTCSGCGTMHCQRRCASRIYGARRWAFAVPKQWILNTF